MNPTKLMITPIPAFHDNYIWLITNTAKTYAAVVDPGDAKPVFDTLQALDVALSAILLTHHHADHTGGVTQLTKKYPVPVFGPSQEAQDYVTQSLTEGDTITLPKLNTSFKVVNIPGHTLGHIAFYDEQRLFCGDTLFACGCGRLFEGTAKQMYHSLQKMAQLSPATEVYCGHEYTAANIKFALLIEPDNPALKSRQRDVQQIRAKNDPSLPSTIELELATNPFLRCHIPSTQQAAEMYSGRKLKAPLEVFAAIRRWKDEF